MAEEKKYDYLEPIKISKDVHWVGFYEEDANLHCNPYVLVDGDEAVIFDPGGIMHYPSVASKVFSVVKPEMVKYIILHHQDPDLCGCVHMLEDVIRNDSLKIVIHPRAKAFIRHYGINSEFYNINENKLALRLKSGRTLKFITTPFCHSPMSFATYDEKEKILFSSDLFAATSSDWNLFAQDGYEEQMKDFHVSYMASTQHLRNIMEKFEKLDLKMILPQHGSIIKGEMMQRCIKFLKQLQCGIDVSAKEAELYG
ncbi:MBL fold metallo-hydrolase [Candidatus Omnitrophota bacterium]